MLQRSPTLQLVLAVAILGSAALAARLLIGARTEVHSEPPAVVAPMVRVVAVRTRPFELSVRGQGEVRPRMETRLVSEVAARVVRLSPSLVDGGFFEQGDVLVELDPTDFELAKVRADAMVSDAGLALALERAESEVAQRAFADIGGEASILALRIPQLEQAQARLAAAEADRSRAAADLERTRIVAPYAGRVRSKSVGVGQFVGRGEGLAEVYATDAAEVRLLLADRELGYLDLPLGFRGEQRREGPGVVLRSEFAGAVHEWRGRIVRIEGEIDPRSRMLAVVARVEDPYGRGAGSPPSDASRPPLFAGLFVFAEIQGRVLEDAVVLPRRAMRGQGRVYVVEGESELAFRPVEVVWSDETRVVIASGLEAGERVVISPLAAAVEGMRVEVDRAPREAPR